MGQVSVPWNSFNCGELSPLLEGRSDMPQYMKGGKTMLNMLPTVQGPATRRGGSRFIGNGTDSSKPSLVVRFSRSATESYVLVFCDQRLQFFFNDGGKVEVAGVPYSIVTPYTQADLFNDDGTPAIQAAESADVVYLAHPKYPPQVLSFFGPTNWTIAPLPFVDGPWQDGNANENLLLYVTGGVTIGSNVTVTCAIPIFQLDMVGSLMRIHQQDLTTVKPWQPGQQTPNIAVGVQRRSGFCTYQAVTVASGPAPPHGSSLLFVQTGGVTLTHTSGNAWDGDQTTTIDPIGGPTFYSTGVEWSYQDCGYGVVQITGFTDGQNVAATVLRQLPKAIIGPSNQTWLWELCAWSDNQGWPACVGFFRQRLTFAGGAGPQNRVWMSSIGDYANFADKYFGEVLEDSAVTVACQSTQVNNVVCLSGGDLLFTGTSGSEFLIGPQSISDPFGPLNVQVSEQSQFGGRNVVPIRAQQFTLFIDKPGRRLRESSFAFTAGPTGSYVSNDKTVLSEHITVGGVTNMAWAKNPNYVIWMALGNGDLISFIYCPEQDVHNWERHDLVEGEVVSMCVIPNSTGEWDDVYLNVRRTNVFNGFTITQYTIERIEQPFANLPGQNQQDAFYVDAGLTLANTIDAILQPGPGYFDVGATDIAFSTNVPVFASTDVGRQIHYDWTTTVIDDDDGLPKAQAAKGIAQITEFLSTTIVLTTIIAQWPTGLSFNPIPVNDWRMTVTEILAASIPSFWYNRTLSFLMDGACAPDQTGPDSNTGNITLAFPASVIQCGLKSPCQFTSMRAEQADRTGTGIGKISRLIRATIRVLNSLGLKLGTSIDDLKEVETRPAGWPDDEAPPLFTGNAGENGRVAFSGKWDREGRFTVRCEQPVPFTMVAGGFLMVSEEDT